MEAVVDLGHADLLPGVLDPGLGVGGQPRAVGLLHVGKVVLLADHSLAGDRNLKSLDIDRVRPELLGQVGSADDRGGRAVAHPAAVKEAQRPGDDGSVQNLLQGDLPLKVGFGVE